MSCEPFQDAISAIVDGEEPGMDRRVLDAHVAHCAGCRTFTDVAERTRHLGAIELAPEMPDLSRRVPALARLADRAGRWSVVRATLAVVAIEVLVFSLPDLIARDEPSATAHGSRHLGAFSVAYAVALLVVVVRPARARTVLPVAGVLAAALTVTAVIDLVHGSTLFLTEARHLPEVVSFGLLWLLARSLGPQRPQRSHPARPVLHGVQPRRRHAG